MAIKLFNHSKLPDKPLHELLKIAQRAVGVKGTIVVKVNRGGYSQNRGEAHQSKSVLIAPRKQVLTNDGWFELNAFWARRDPASFFNTMLHEFGHVRDYQIEAQTGEKLAWSSRRSWSGRRPRWRDRPEEERAIGAAEDAMMAIREDYRYFRVLHELKQLVGKEIIEL
jgi:hypothetical protein